jgi:hypothetical protein
MQFPLRRWFISVRVRGKLRVFDNFMLGGLLCAVDSPCPGLL